MKKEFSLKDFLILLLRKWPIIAGCAIVCALLLGASAYITSSPEVQDVEPNNPLKVELENVKAEINQLQVLKNNIRQSNVASGLLDMNMYGANFYNLSFMIRGKDDNSDVEEIGLALSYANQITTGAIYQDLAIAEAELLPQIIAAYANEGVVFICAYQADHIDVEQIVHDIFDYIQTTSGSISVELLMAEEGILSQEFHKIFADRQENTMRRIDYYDAAIKLRAQTKDILEVEMGLLGDATPNPIRRGVLGFAAGAVFGVLLGLLMDFFNTTLKDERELEYMGLYNLCGAHILTTGKKRFFLNRFIDFLAGRVYYYMSEEEQVVYVMAKIAALFVDEKETHNILLTGVATSEKVRKFYERLQTKGKEEGYHFILGENANISTKTVEALKSVEHVILIEHLNESKLTEVSKICQLMEQQKKEIVGFLVV